MAGVTKEQVAAARRMTAIEFLRRYRANDLVKSSARGEFELKSHDSFKINGESSLWHWKSRGIGGKSALDYLMHVEGCSFVEAVRLLCDEQPVFTPQKHADVERKRPPFKLPEKSPTTTRLEAYLRCRGISPQVIQKCIDDGILYESLPYHNCVFVGRDVGGIPVFASRRGTYDLDGSSFKRDVPGSDKRVAFRLPSRSDLDWVLVFEAPIDLMSYLTLHRQVTSNAVALCGVYGGALESYLKDYPHIKQIGLCLDVDEPGRVAAEHLRAQVYHRLAGREDSHQRPRAEIEQYAAHAHHGDSQSNAHLRHGF